MTRFWKQFNSLSKEERLATTLEHLPQQELFDALEKARAKGRNDYPIPTLWSALLMSFTHRTPSIEALRATLPSLPPPSAISRFLTRLIEQIPLIEKVQQRLIHPLPKPLVLACGELILETPIHLSSTSSRTRRSSQDADFGEKIIYDEKHSGNRLITWHGYRLHYILEAEQALPLISFVTPASTSSSKAMLSLLKKLEERHPEVLEVSEYALGDATYDDEQLIDTLWNHYRIKPIFALAKASSCSLFTPVAERKNAVYNDLGEVFCAHPHTKERLPMAFAGFEKERGCLKYRCQASSYGVVCKGSSRCLAKKGVRIPLSTNKRLFTPVARSSYKWQGLHSHLRKQEFYQSYLKETLLSKLPHTRGLDKLSLYNLLANLVLLSNYTSMSSKIGFGQRES